MPHWLPARCVQGPQRSLRGQFARRPGRDTFLLRGSSVVADQASATPTDKMALIRRDDTFTVAPWTPALDRDDRANTHHLVVGSRSWIGARHLMTSHYFPPIAAGQGSSGRHWQARRGLSGNRVCCLGLCPSTERQPGVWALDGEL